MLDTPGEPQTIAVALGKPLALLAYLALAPRRTASRERLTDLLWGDQDRSTARHSLRGALYYLRSRMGEWAVETTDQSCTASPEVRVDALEFIDALEREEFGRALELYGGDFLADFASPGCREFEHWAEIERAHLRSRAVTAGEALCRDLLDQGRFGDARRAAERVREVDPQSELARRLVLEAFVASGDRVGAAAEAARLEVWLSAEGRDAEPATIEAIRTTRHTLASRTMSGSPAAGLSAELVGRERQFSALLDAWQRANQGSTQYVVVSGAAGLGKSRLLSAFESRLRAQRQRVLHVRAYPGERANAFAFASALAHGLARLRGGAGTPASVTPHLVALDSRLSEQFRVPPSGLNGTAAVTPRSIALRELIAAVCDEAPVVLLIDDAHWLDALSCQLLAGTLARLDALPLLVVIATRSADSGCGIEGRALELQLEPLSVDDVEALVASLGTLPTGEEWPAFLVARITAAARGVPLFVLGALEQLLADGTLELRDGVWRVRDIARARDRLRHIDALGARLRALREPAFRFLVALSLAGVPVPRAIASRLAQQFDPALADPPDELERLGYIRVGESTVEVVHDAVAETALDIASPESRSEVGNELGRVLLDQPHEQWVERGIRCLVTAGAPTVAHAALRRLANTRSNRTARNPAHDVARIMSLPTDDPRVAAAVRALPFAVRFPVRRASFVAAFLLLTATATGAFVRATAPPPPDALLEISARTDRLRARTALVSIRGSSWSTTDALPLAWQRTKLDTNLYANFGPQVRPERDQWAIDWHAPDAGAQNVVLAGPTGITEHLTDSPYDAVPSSWSPDGSLLAIETAKYGRAGHRVVGILDVARKTILPLAGGLGFESNARWSPDGTRIAFTRDTRDGSPLQLCVSPLSGYGEWCVAPAGYGWLLGWRDGDHLLAAVRPRSDSVEPPATGDLPESEVTELDTRTRQLRRTGLRVFPPPDLSADGRWLVYFDAASHKLSDLRIASTSDLLHAKRLASSVDLDDIFVHWRGTAERRVFLDSVRIDAPSDTIVLGAPFQVRASGISNQHTLMTARAVEWRSLDTTIAQIDSTGIVRARSPGIAKIEASAGGWRRTLHTFIVIATPLDTLLAENWTSLEPRWKPYGTPLPMIVHDSVLGAAFWNHGNGTYFSGVYLRSQEFDPRSGLALDATVRIWITQDQWQYLDLELIHLRDIEQLSNAWDHRHGYLPSQFMGGAASCDFAYPAGEGAAAVLASAPGGELPHAPGAKLPPLGLGVPTWIRLQILPDGRCGVAINGRAVYLSPTFDRLDSLRILVQGSSLGTRVLVGPLLVRRGVPPGIDWNQISPVEETPK